MRRVPTPKLLSVLRTTVSQLEKNTDLAPDDPALADLKKALLHRIANLQMESAPESNPSPEKPIEVPNPAVKPVGTEAA
jgi:hypothetical protein